MPLDTAVLSPALSALPIFPLPGVVLFPRAILPLHIFEPRYRALVADAMTGHRCLAMAFAMDSGDSPRIAPIAGAGVIIFHEPLPDGRSNIALHGLSRVRLDELPFEPPYRRARARILDEGSGEVGETARRAMGDAASAFVAEARRHAIAVDFELPQGSDPAAAADLYAHHLIVDGSARQRVLEELDVGARALLVAAELSAQTAYLSRDRGLGSN